MLSKTQKAAIERAISCIDADRDRLEKLNGDELDEEDRVAIEETLELLNAALNEDLRLDRRRKNLDNSSR